MILGAKCWGSRALRKGSNLETKRDDLKVLRYRTDEVSLPGIPIVHYQTIAQKRKAEFLTTLGTVFHLTVKNRYMNLFESWSCF